MHAVDRYLALTRKVTGLAEDQIEWPLPEGKAPRAIAGRDADLRFVLLHPFSRGEGKSLTPEQVGAFCEKLAPIQVVIAGRAEQQAPRLPNVIDLLNATDLHELIWLIRHARFVVSVDSGPMHIAAAVTSQLISIHTWSDPAKVGPYRPDAWVWQNGRLYQQRDREYAAAHREAANIADVAEFLKTQV